MASPPFVFLATRTERVKAMADNAPRRYRMQIIFDRVVDLRHVEEFCSGVFPINEKNSLVITT